MTQLSVNINKIALLRNARGNKNPDVLELSNSILNMGVGGITVHPRPDERHITSLDVNGLSQLIRKSFPTKELNIEGNPFDKKTDKGNYLGFMEIISQNIPHQATLVPDSQHQLTSDHGWNLEKEANRLEPLIQKLKDQKIRVSLFLDISVNSNALKIAQDMGVDRVELYTEPYALAYANPTTPKFQATLKHYQECAEKIQQFGIKVNAGHDLSQQNLGQLIQAIPTIQEVSIGHALICESLVDGLEKTVKNYLSILRK